MAREIKFRAWVIRKRKGSFMVRESFYNTIGFRGNELIPKWGGKENVIIMQYTGLKDKNGKEIYEGDIVEGKWGDKIIGKVKYRNSESAFCIYWNEKKEKNEWDAWHYLCEVEPTKIIGNIYENPELLEVK